MAPPQSLAHLAVRALNASSPLHVGARVGNFYSTTSNYSCDSVSVSYGGGVPPIAISIINGSSLPLSYWTYSNSSAVNVSNVSVLETIATVNSASGEVSWDVDVEQGSWVGLQAKDAEGTVAFSQLRTVYNGGKDDSECQALSPDPDPTSTGPRIGTNAGNLYLASTEFPCSPVSINYDGLSPPLSIDLFNASPSLLPPGSDFFNNLTPPNTTQVQIIKNLGIVNYTLGYLNWTIDSSTPPGSRVGWRITDREGQVGFSEVRTIYRASESSKAACAPHTQGITFPDDDPRSPYSRPEVRFGLFVAGLAALALLFFIFFFCVGLCVGARDGARGAGAGAEEQGAGAGAGAVQMQEREAAAERREEEEAQRETVRERDEGEEDLPTYQAAVDAGRKGFHVPDSA